MSLQSAAKNIFSSVLFFSLFLFFQSCSGDMPGALPETIDKNDKSVFFLTSKGPVWWLIHKDEKENNWWLYIKDVNTNQLLSSSTIYSDKTTDSKNYKFNYQQKGDKLWYINPAARLEARNLLDGSQSENHNTIKQKYRNIRGDIQTVTDARADSIYLATGGYVFSFLDGMLMYFDNEQMLLMEYRAFEKTFGERSKSVVYLLSQDSCIQNEKDCCPVKLFHVAQKVGMYERANFNRSINQVLKEDVHAKVTEEVVEAAFRGANVLYNDGLFSLVAYIENNHPMLLCYDMKSSTKSWKQSLAMEKLSESDCRKFTQNLTATVFKGECLVQTKNGERAWCFNISNGNLNWSKEALTLLKSDKKY
jgi:hypothetical protein